MHTGQRRRNSAATPKERNREYRRATGTFWRRLLRYELNRMAARGEAIGATCREWLLRDAAIAQLNDAERGSGSGVFPVRAAKQSRTG